MSASSLSKFGISDKEMQLQQLIASIRRKNTPIILVGTFCAVILAISLTVSIFLYVQICQMDDELKLATEEFKDITDRSWQMLLHDDGHREGFDARTKRSPYFPSSSANSAQKCQCAQSAQNCPIGPTGVPGEKGEPGVPGSLGKPGPIGESAGKYEFESVKPPCVLCPAGPPGIKGRPGFPGVVGPVGQPGEIGKPGADGRPGTKGPPGDYGPAGTAGSIGLPGPPGTDSHSWAKIGTKGAKGPSGPPGPSGDSGAPGSNGEPGEDGTPGEPGQSGLQGNDGPAGKPGNRGSPGRPAADANYCPCPPRSDKGIVGTQAAVYAKVAPPAGNKFNFRARADFNQNRAEIVSRKTAIHQTVEGDKKVDKPKKAKTVAGKSAAKIAETK